jgi:Predicted metal-binding integral membrane protein (DUF2182)
MGQWMTAVQRRDDQRTAHCVGNWRRAEQRVIVRMPGGFEYRAMEVAQATTWVFVSSYLVIWTLFGSAGIYLGAVWIEGLAQQVPWLTANDGRIGGGVLVLAGLHQLSPLKRSRLAKCRTPLDFILSSWRDGYVSSFHMGLEHGIYCLGCCWLLFVIFFPLGMMNVAVMAVVTILIFAEKSLPIRKANFPVGRPCTDRLWDVGGNDARGAAHDGSTNVYADIHANAQWAGETELEGRVSPSHSIASTLILRDRYAISMKEVSFASIQKEYVDIFKAKQ